MDKPTPEKIDELAREYLEIEKQREESGAALAAKAEELAPLVERFGTAHAKKSKLLVGLLYEMMTTTSSTTSVDAAGIEKLQIALKRADMAPLFKKLFRKVTRWEIAPTADVVLRGDLPKGAPKDLRSLFTQAVRIETKPARLSDVRARKSAGADVLKTA